LHRRHEHEQQCGHESSTTKIDAFNRARNLMRAALAGPVPTAESRVHDFAAVAARRVRAASGVRHRATRPSD